MVEWYMVITPQNQEEICAYLFKHHAERARGFLFKEGFIINFVIYSDKFEEVYYFTKDHKFDCGRECSSIEKLKQEMFEYKLTL